VVVRSSSPFFSVLVVNYNGGHFLQSAIDSLKQQTFEDFEVIVVDNASSDESASTLDASGLENFQLLLESENHGFAGGNNLAARMATGKWLALLNPDAEANADWLQKVADGIARYPNVQGFACAQYSMFDDKKLDGAGDNYLLWGIPWRGGFGRDRTRLPNEGECFAACGASAIYNRDVFLSHGGFDERLFCFCEDVDLGFRMQLSGQACIFLPDAIIRHAGGGLSDKVGGFSTRLGTRNRLWVYLKNMPMVLLVPTLPIHIMLTIAILMRGAMTGKLGDVLSGLSEAITHLPKGISGRRAIQRDRKVSSLRLLRIMPVNPIRLLQRGTFVKSVDRPDEGGSTGRPDLLDVPPHMAAK